MCLVQTWTIVWRSGYRPTLSRSCRLNAWTLESVFLLKPSDASSCIDNLLLACVKRVADWANFNTEIVFQCGASLKTVSANTSDFNRWVVWMNIFFHDSMNLVAQIMGLVDQWSAQMIRQCLLENQIRISVFRVDFVNSPKLGDSSHRFEEFGIGFSFPKSFTQKFNCFQVIWRVQ